MLNALEHPGMAVACPSTWDGHNRRWEASQDESRRLHVEIAVEVEGRAGLKSPEVLIAACLSARDRREISLPLEY